VKVSQGYTRYRHLRFYLWIPGSCAFASKFDTRMNLWSLFVTDFDHSGTSTVQSSHNTAYNPRSASQLLINR